MNVDELKNGPIWELADDGEHILKKRIVASGVGVSIFILVALAQFFLFRHSLKAQSKNINVTKHTVDDEESVSESDASSQTKPISKPGSRLIAHYAMVSAMMNSFLVGGLTFGYSGMVLILRKEGVYSESCSCGSFW